MKYNFPRSNIKNKRKRKMANVELMVPFIRKWEGGWVDDPDDAGGCTMVGITIATYQKYYGKDKTCDDLRFITQEEWLHIFKTGYWDKMKADQIENQSIAQLCVDMAWNSGLYWAIRKMQNAIGVKDDGIIGPKTLAALNAKPHKEVFDKIWNMRYEWLCNIAKKGNNKKFLKGWLNRLNDIKFEG